MGYSSSVILVSLFGLVANASAHLKLPETLFKDLGLKADALEYFNRVAADVVDSYAGGSRFEPNFYGPGEGAMIDIDGKDTPTEHPATTFSAKKGSPTYAPKKKPLYSFPCGDYAPPQELLYVKFDPNEVYEPKKNCKKLTKKYLNPFQMFQNDYDPEPTCRYKYSDGGPVYPKEKYGKIVQPHAPLGVVVVSKGKCSNIYFGQKPGAELAAPRVDDYGNCDPPKGYGKPHHGHGGGYGKPDHGGGYGKPDHHGGGYGKPDHHGSGYGKPDRHGSGYGKPDRHGSGYGKPDHGSGYGKTGSGYDRTDFGYDFHGHRRLEAKQVEARDYHHDPYPSKTHYIKYDYLLECTCVCDKPYSPGGYGDTHDKPGYGKDSHHGSGYGKDHHGSGYGRDDSGYGRDSHHGSGYGKDFHHGSGYGKDSHHGSGYGKDSHHGSGYGKDSHHGSGYGKDSHRSGYGRDDSHHGSGYGRDDSHHGSGYGGNSHHGSGYGSKPKSGYDTYESDDHHSGYGNEKPLVYYTPGYGH